MPPPPPESELTIVIKSLDSSLRPDSSDNHFISHFLNRFPADIDAELKK
jgi:hypothetical protein